MKSNEDKILSDFFKQTATPEYSSEFTDKIMHSLPERKPFPVYRIVSVMLIWIVLISLTLIFRESLMIQFTEIIVTLQQYSLPSIDEIWQYVAFIAMLSLCIQQTLRLIDDYNENKYYVKFKNFY